MEQLLKVFLGCVLATKEDGRRRVRHMFRRHPGDGTAQQVRGVAGADGDAAGADGDAAS